MKKFKAVFSTSCSCFLILKLPSKKQKNNRLPLFEFQFKLAPAFFSVLGNAYNISLATFAFYTTGLRYALDAPAFVVGAFTFFRLMNSPHF
ncbi:hypothetical protein A3G55_01440 [Candidatus Giovannonibacteria bacterium RIFCSPLOWO2_12_FULL_44_25]|uniref:Uncharacterized protein n=1 Tax=Candidatus Giovannonibacteria bacterium RIFCSPHIGHO2_02_FULL_45_40 TaxID=1798337 RepID=A0A1F5WA49_9BACT|nr:MAG: hypothetical protein A2120_03275 [Candidatus Giovannonibacteria bacterium GWA2_45_15]OGF60986.1 MAG: hypothetical protein A2656_01890 [Candidatus Giovannonibacteria bacterium RIFCSPHIGHO2_01_FULL_44_100]OGF72161.1 MAG: hypothetical protein A3C05_02960 [Candidatus Giovannonibacteria bacterium RIFCSPHIGHO2_02_FULL_45_40]OGF84552.1 MAG: hypothetical protein A3A19_00275 [Candidatus Giovannonibacteria bacterium RIFCSPLOWO2_01_FULL_45_140]OGF85161.1 MAG: hypothetical protein A3E63_04855 [Cand